jgi:hypothetical protein
MGIDKIREIFLGNLRDILGEEYPFVVAEHK